MSANYDFLEITTAYTVLKDDDQRQKYDNNHKNYKYKRAVDSEDLYTAEFAFNAADYDSEDTSTDESELNDYNKTPNQFMLNIYDRETSSINEILSDNDKKKCVIKLEIVNQKIQK